MLVSACGALDIRVCSEQSADREESLLIYCKNTFIMGMNERDRESAGKKVPVSWMGSFKFNDNKDFFSLSYTHRTGEL
jgi:hypothetical protein